jgi:hypothetical protein
VPEPIILPTIFNVDKNVAAPTTSKTLILVLLKIVVDVACKFDMFNCVLVEKLFKLLNMVVDVALYYLYLILNSLIMNLDY